MILVKRFMFLSPPKKSTKNVFVNVKVAIFLLGLKLIDSSTIFSIFHLYLMNLNMPKCLKFWLEMKLKLIHIPALVVFVSPEYLVSSEKEEYQC